MEKEVIAVDLGGSNMRVAVVRNNAVAKYSKVSTPKSKKELLEKLSTLIKSNMNSKISGICVACPGPLKNGKILNTPNIPLKNFDFKRFLKKKFNKRVEIENDAACVALAELNFGIKKKNFIVLTLGTGIGGGVVLDGKLFDGQGPGGELGHIILDNGKDFEELASGKSIKKYSKKEFGKELMVSELVKMKDRKAKKIIETEIKYLGQGISSLVNIFNPEIVVLAGGFRESGKFFIREVQKKTRKYNIVNKNIYVVWSKLEHPGILGAASLIAEK